LRGGGWRTEVRRYESKGKQLQRLPGPMKLDRTPQNQTQSHRRRSRKAGWTLQIQNIGVETFCALCSGL
jgi:hypothetical protein